MHAPPNGWTVIARWPSTRLGGIINRAPTAVDSSRSLAVVRFANPSPPRPRKNQSCPPRSIFSSFSPSPSPMTPKLHNLVKHSLRAERGDVRKSAAGSNPTLHDRWKSRLHETHPIRPPQINPGRYRWSAIERKIFTPHDQQPAKIPVCKNLRPAARLSFGSVLNSSLHNSSSRTVFSVPADTTTRRVAIVSVTHDVPIHRRRPRRYAPFLGSIFVTSCRGCTFAPAASACARYVRSSVRFLATRPPRSHATSDFRQLSDGSTSGGGAMRRASLGQSIASGSRLTFAPIARPASSNSRVRERSPRIGLGEITPSTRSRYGSSRRSPHPEGQPASKISAGGRTVAAV